MQYNLKKNLTFDSHKTDKNLPRLLDIHLKALTMNKFDARGCSSSSTVNYPCGEGQYKLYHKKTTKYTQIPNSYL